MAAKVRIFALDMDEPRVELRRLRKESEADDRVVVRREREVTAIRSHAFLLQTLPPSDPVVREIERRRSGSKDEEG